MSFFKKIGKSVNKAFTKAPEVVSSIFKKGGDIAQKVSGGIGKVSDALGKVGSVINNPLVQAGASSLFGPEAGMALGSIGKNIGGVRKGLNMGSDIAGRAGALSKEASGYKSLADAKGGIQKAKELVSDARGVAGPQFA
jgi:hypothetical protein